MVKRMIGAGLFGLAVLSGCASMSKPAPAAKTDYFEYRADGQQYVFGTVQEMQKFVKTKKLTSSTTEYINGYPIVFDNTDPADTARLMKEYEKAHK